MPSWRRSMMYHGGGSACSEVGLSPNRNAEAKVMMLGVQSRDASPSGTRFRERSRRKVARSAPCPGATSVSIGVRSGRRFRGHQCWSPSKRSGSVSTDTLGTKTRELDLLFGVSSCVVGNCCNLTTHAIVPWQRCLTK